METTFPLYLYHLLVVLNIQVEEAKAAVETKNWSTLVDFVLRGDAELLTNLETGDDQTSKI